MAEEHLDHLHIAGRGEYRSVFTGFPASVSFWVTGLHHHLQSVTHLEHSPRPWGLNNPVSYW
ncbi:hypothetical protein ALP06_200329 [Pseudomonas coronafaciens pv. atropurpurea]|nr:hypothetical protein ALP06_200329 [Pseudomonas coronafaciens pv. atropurpurea]